MTELWQQRWPDCLPVGYKLRDPYRDVWVRFHSLPESKRYAVDESEYAVVLERYNTVLDELFAGTEVYVVTPFWATEPEVPLLEPDAGYWQSLLVEDDPEPEFRTYCHLFAARLPWQHGCIDRLLRDTAHDKVAGVLVTDSLMQRIYHPLRRWRRRLPHHARGTGPNARSAYRLALQPSVRSLTGSSPRPPTLHCR
ncbi:hypothetical protein RCR19_28830 [Streptomyces sp. WAC07094]|uniref:DUF3885 domain-containing protein n=1 Tax=Streptomyces sp. WAC07094 TaxID=3072183 RepID=UPI002EC91B1E|nr:hypothetical protein [Streptomyces sp. WAC07094]